MQKVISITSERQHFVRLLKCRRAEILRFALCEATVQLLDIKKTVSFQYMHRCQ